MPLHVILTTGGTGGHIFPALAVSEALKKRHPDVEILFIGGLSGQEKDIVPKHNLSFVGLPVHGLKGKGLRAVFAIFSMISAIIKSISIIKKFKPDVVVGFGGYAAFSTVFAGILLKRPCLIHEQNAAPGSANKFLGKFVNKICLSWSPGEKKSFPLEKCIITGNPVRADFFADVSKSAWDKRPLIIMGGSLGAHSINTIMTEIVPSIINEGIPVIHQTGKKDYEPMIAAYKAKGITIGNSLLSVHSFIDDVPQVLQNCRMAICRAGATTMAELAATGTPALYIPFPFAIHDHQTANARAMEIAGGGILLNETKALELLKNGKLIKLILSLLNDKDQLDKMSKNAYTLASPNAAEYVAEEIERLVTQK